MKTIKNLVNVALLLMVFTSNGQNNLTNSDNQIKTDSTRIASGVRYNFYPNLDAYYDLQTSEFIFKVDGEWIKDKTIPNSYRGYSMYNNYHVDITNYFGDKPYEKLADHKKEFPYYSNDRKGKLAAMLAQKKAEAKEKNLAMN